MKKICKILSLFVLFYLSGIGQEIQAQSTNQTVRVAFLPEMYGFYIIEENGNFSGYNYDYLMNVAQHTNWDYEFIVIEEGSVSASLAKAEEMMLSGDLDLLGPYSATSPRFEDFETGEKNYGIYRYNYYAALNNNTISRDNFFLQDSLTVGLVEYYAELNDLYFQEMKLAGLDIEPVYVKSHGEMIELLLTEEVDTIINLDMSSHSEYLNYLTTIQRIPFYFASTKGNTQLMESLDKAIERIEIIEPDIHQRLLNTYFGVHYEGDFTVSEQERQLLEQIDSFKVGFLKNIPPYQYVNQEGINVGISIGIIEKLEEIIGIPFEAHWYDDLEELYIAIATEEIDLVGTLSNNYALAQSIDVTLTTPYISGGVYWLKNQNSSENTTPMYHYVSDNIPFFNKEELAMVWDVKNALDTVENSPDVSMICDPNITDYYLSLYEYDNITVQAVSNVLSEMSFGVGNHIDVITTGMLNRAIFFLDTYEIDELIYTHTSVKPEYTYWDFVRDYAFEINIALIVVAGCIIVSIYGTSKKFRELSRHDSLTNIYNSGYFHQYVEHKLESLTSGVLILVDIDFFKDVNDSHGHNMGDKIIKQVAENMKKFGNSKGFYARVGGDEFALLLEGTVDKEQLEKEAASVLKALTENETGIPVTLSMGAFIFHDSISYEILYKSADTVLYKVKEKGRNGFLISDTVDTTILNKASNLLNHAMFQQKVTQLITTELPSKNHALLMIRLEQLDMVDAEGLSDFYDEVAVRIKNQVRQHDFLCSQENSSFLLFLTSCGTMQNLSDCKQRLETSLNLPYCCNSKEFSVETKVFVAIYPENGTTYPELKEKLQKDML